jgi:hypothetical protein
MAGPRDPDEIEDEGPLQEGDDAGQIDDEGGDESETGQELEGVEAEERVDRRSRRDDTLREELRAEREHRARVEAELQIIRQEREARNQPRGPREETEEEFNQRIAMMDPEARFDAKLARHNRIQDQKLALATFAAADRADKGAFDSRAQTDPRRKRNAARVEQLLQEERRRGRDFDRETIYKFVLGEEADKAMSGRGPSPARREAERRVASQQARTTGGRGDARRDERPRRYAANDMSPEAVRQRLNADDAYI